MTLYQELGLDRTVRVSRGTGTVVGTSYPNVGRSIWPELAAPAVQYESVVERGIESRHEAANVKCGFLMEGGDLCTQRAFHAQRKDAKVPHVPADRRLLAAGRKVVRTLRFSPGGIPAGVDMYVTVPHNCENHLQDVEDLTREAFLRGN